MAQAGGTGKVLPPAHKDTCWTCHAHGSLAVLLPRPAQDSTKPPLLRPVATAGPKGTWLESASGGLLQASLVPASSSQPPRFFLSIQLVCPRIPNSSLAGPPKHDDPAAPTHPSVFMEEHDLFDSKLAITLLPATLGGAGGILLMPCSPAAAVGMLASTD